MINQIQNKQQNPVKAISPGFKKSTVVAWYSLILKFLLPLSPVLTLYQLKSQIHQLININNHTLS